MKQKINLRIVAIAAISILAILCIGLTNYVNAQNKKLVETEVTTSAKIAELVEVNAKLEAENNELQAEQDNQKAELQKLSKQVSDGDDKLKAIKKEQSQWRALVNATFILETGHGRSKLWKEHNNPGGIKCGSNYCHFESKEIGMQKLEKKLKQYVKKYGYDLRKIRSVYAPGSNFKHFERIFNQQLKSTKKVSV